MLDPRVRRLLNAYPAIYLACHRQHNRQDETGAAVTERQASILDHLDPSRPTTLSKLAEHMGIGRSAMSIAVTNLVRGGYVRRIRDRRDSRAVALTLSPAGARVAEQNSILDPELLQKMFRSMPATELEAALLGIERLAAAAKTLLRQRKRAHDQ